MNILVITPNYTPEITAYVHLVTSLCEDLVEAGNNVTVLTPTPIRGLSEEQVERYKNNFCERNGRLTIIRIPTSMPAVKNFNKRILSALTYTCKSLKTALKQKQVDLIFTYSTPPTLGITGLIVSLIKKKPMVYNLQDIFPDSAINTGMMKNKLMITIARIIEKLIYSWSDVVTVIGEDFITNILKKGVKKEKIVLIPNWVDETELKYISRNENNFLDKYKIDKEKFIIIYSGNLGLSQNFESLFYAANKLKKYEDILFILVGDGVRKEELILLRNQLQLNNVEFIPFQPQSDIAKVYSAGDIGLVTLKPKVTQNSVPSKTWSIMACERPLIASVDLDSELAKLLNQEKCGLAVDPTDSEKLVEAILSIYKNRGQALEFGKKGRRYIEKFLGRKTNTTRYNQLFKTLVENK